MNIIDLRKNLRESTTNQRKNSDRRQNPYPFNSHEWLEYIQRNGLERPAFDRRKTLRRANDRQAIENQHQDSRPYTRILLTSAERKLLSDIYLSDFDSL